jgi:signal transduction histidine kinase
MKIRTRIAIQFTLLVSTILLVFAISIYFFASYHRANEFNSRLKDRALTTAKLFADVDEVDGRLLKIIDRNSINALSDEQVLIYDAADNLIYSSVDTLVYGVDSHTLDQVRDEKEMKFLKNGNEAVGIHFDGKYDEYVVIASAYDKYGYSKLKYLKYLLVFGLMITVIFTLVLGLFFSRHALSPMAGVVEQVDKISISNLNLRVNEGNGKDEIAQLAHKFNRMLERLEAAFEMQRSFVANASHELRTPLTVLTGQLEVALMNEKAGEETKQVLHALLKDIKQLNKLSNGLLDLAQANLDVSELKLTKLRIDELVGLARAELIKQNRDYTIELNLVHFPEEENWLIVLANEQLLRAAIVNIIENGCKYSRDSTTQIKLEFDQTNVYISVIDRGIGISEPDLNRVFEPFYRSLNAKTFSGHGIGLTLAQKIIQLHNGEINVSSRLNEGTTVKLTIPHI